MKMFSDETIRTMFINNPDGAGYMYFNPATKKVVIKKGYMNEKTLIKSLHSKDFTNTNVILHFRIGTSGLYNALNCHPYPVFEKNALTCSTDLGMAHNGILTNFSPPKKSDINDTQMFINTVLKGLKKNFLRDADKLNLIKFIIGTNKLAFLDNRNKVTLLGNFVTDKGYIFSNDSYKKETLYYYPPVTKKSTKKSKVKEDSSIPNWDKWDYWDDGYKTSYGDKSFWDGDRSEFWDDYDKRHPYTH